MKSVIVLDLDETLEHGVIDDKTGKTNMILRPNLDVLINKLKEVKCSNESNYRKKVSQEKKLKKKT